MSSPSEVAPLLTPPNPGEFTPPPPEARTQDAFFERWGEVSGFTREQFSLMWDVSARHIGTEYGYHNEQHPRELLWVAMEFVDWLEAQGHKVNRKVIIGTVMYHDDDYHEDHEAKGYSSKEEWAAVRFREDANLYDYTPEEVELGAEVIITTRRKEKPKTIEGLVMVVADIWNVGASYDKEFHPRTESYASEIEKKQLKKGEDFSMSAFLTESVNVLSDYAWSLINQRLCDLDNFLRQAIPNIFNIAREAAKLENMTIDEYVKKLNNPVFNKILDYYKSLNKKAN